jgi:putative adhesin
MNTKVVWPLLALGALRSGLLFAETTAEFHRTLPLAPADHIVLDVAVPTGNVVISYAHAGEISVSATARAEGKIPTDYFDRRLVVEREGEHVKVQFNSKNAPADDNLRIAYTIDVPNWIVVNSNVGTGKQTISGVMGPVRAVSGSGNVKVLYVTDALEVKTGRGDITVIRVGAAARAETGSGNINMKDIGPGSIAAVRDGPGRVDVDGISGSFTGSTDAGELHVAGAVYDTWELKSASGNIMIGVTAESKFDIDAVTSSGRLSVDNDDIDMPNGANPRACHQKVNGGGKLVRARSVSGTIFIH